jgi:hypothetical protein
MFFVLVLCAVMVEKSFFVFSIVAILFGSFVQYLSFSKDALKLKVPMSTPFSILLGFVINLAGVALLGRLYWPLIIQGICIVCSWIILTRPAELAACWERKTMLLM